MGGCDGGGTVRLREGARSAGTDVQGVRVSGSDGVLRVSDDDVLSQFFASMDNFAFLSPSISVPSLFHCSSSSAVRVLSILLILYFFSVRKKNKAS